MSLQREEVRSIGEVADSLDLPAHVLRFWETRFKEIEPVKRAGGRRYYRQRDVELVAAIRSLLYGEGYTIKGVQRILREYGVRAVIEGARTGDFHRDDPPAGPSRDTPSPEIDGADRLVAKAASDDLRAGFAEPEPQPDDDESPGGVAAARSEAEAASPEIAPPPVAAALSPQDRERLNAALDELAACRLLLERLRE